MSERTKPTRSVGKTEKPINPVCESADEKPISMVGKRGKDKQPRKKRCDMISTALTDDERMNILKHNLQIAALPKINPNNPDQLSDRVMQYFTICAENNLSPAVASFALSLGVDRRTLWTWMANDRGVIKNQQSLDIIKTAYSIINAQYEDMLNTSKINPISAIFLMKNNLGYKDQTDHILTARTEQPDTEDTVIDRAMLLEGETIR